MTSSLVRSVDEFEPLASALATWAIGTANERGGYNCALLPWSGSCNAQVAEARRRFIFL